uniref:Uncharacterized protein n=1 Tax=Panagrolaimus sp. ES5 TaxID=591445 RepID=A0AC34FCX7_9BILA
MSTPELTPTKRLKIVQKSIAAASNKVTKKRSNPFSKYMKVCKTNLAKRKSNENERMKRIRDAKKRNPQRGKGFFQVSMNKILELQQVHIDDLPAVTIDDDVMEMHLPQNYITPDIIQDEPPEATVESTFSEANIELTSNGFDEKDFIFVPKKNIKLITKRSILKIWAFCHSMLAQIIQQLNVEPIQGRSEYNGNSCRKIVNYFGQNNPVSTNEIPMFYLFKLAAKLQKFSIAKNLTTQEIDECEETIDTLYDYLDGLRNFKYNNKLHILRFHVIPFINIHGSWGNYSEQGIERLHCLVNEYRNRITSKNDFKQNIYAMQMLILATYFHDFK